MDITLEDINDGLRGDISDFGANHPRPQVVLRGGRSRITLSSGIHLQMQDSWMERDLVTYLTRPANVMLHLVLAGRIRGALGQERVDMAVEEGQEARLYFSALACPTEFRREVQRGQHIQKITALISWDWLVARGVLPEALLQGRMHRFAVWPAQAADTMRAQTLLAGQEQALDIFGALTAEMFSLSLVQQALTCALQPGEALCAADRARLDRVEATALREGPALSLEALAEIGGVSVSSLRRLFRKARNMTVHGRLRQIRMERAAILLRSGMAVAEVARLTGYETPTAFATAFRKYSGQSPSEWR